MGVRLVRLVRFPLAGAVLAFTALVLAVAPAGATISQVTDCGDTVPGGAPGQLRRLINDAGFGDTIVIPGCRITLAGAAGEDLNQTGDLDLIKDVTLQGAGAGRTILDGGGVDRVLDVRSGTPVIQDLTITNGRVAGTGGGVRVAFTAFGAILRRVEVAGNTVTGSGGNGGGVFAERDLYVELSTVHGNTAPDGLGGGLAHQRFMRLEKSTVSGNTALGGGGIASGPQFPGYTLLVSQSTISGNRATGSGAPPTGSGLGGGIVAGSAGSKHVFQSTMVDNQATLAGSGIAVVSPPAVNLRASIVARNGPASCGAAAVVSAGRNLYDDASCPSVPDDLTSPDPLLGPLAANGGPTLTHALLPGSPAIDRGGEEGCPSVDQRGVRRPQDGDGDGQARCDIGAVERRRPAATRTAGE